ALTAAAAALAVLARPEAILIVPLLLFAERPTFGRIAIFSGITALVLAPSVAFSLLTVGAPFPATAAAKVEGGLLGWLAGVRESPALTWLYRPGRFLADWIGWVWRGAAPLALP